MKSLESVQVQTYANRELVIVDNASTDGTAEMVRERFPEAVLVRSHKNLGCPSGRNLGVANCTGKYVYFLDDDGWLERDALEKVVARAESDETLGVIMSQIRMMDGDRFVEARPVGLSEPCYRSTFSGGCSLIRRDIFEQFGFPDDFFRQAEEDDLTLRMMDVGRYCYFDPESVMYHKPSPINRNMPMFVYFGLRNTQKTGLRYWPFPYNILRVLRIALYGLQFAVIRGRVFWPAWLFGNFVRDMLTLRGHRKPVRMATFRMFLELKKRPSSIHPGTHQCPKRRSVSGSMRRIRSGGQSTWT